MSNTNSDIKHIVSKWIFIIIWLIKSVVESCCCDQTKIIFCTQLNLNTVQYNELPTCTMTSSWYWEETSSWKNHLAWFTTAKSLYCILNCLRTEWVKPQEDRTEWVIHRKHRQYSSTFLMTWEGFVTFPLNWLLNLGKTKGGRGMKWEIHFLLFKICFGQ